MSQFRVMAKEKPRRERLGFGKNGTILRGCGGHLIEDLRSLAGVRNPENHHRRVRSRLNSRIGLVDVDVSFTEFRGRAGQCPGTVWDLRFRYL